MHSDVRFWFPTVARVIVKIMSDLRSPPRKRKRSTDNQGPRKVTDDDTGLKVFYEPTEGEATIDPSSKQQPEKD